jgi:hypothetical protein
MYYNILWLNRIAIGHPKMKKFGARKENSYQIFWEVVDLERGPLSLVSTTEELLGRNSSCSGL